jgi:Na+/H+ antiporter NhaB
MGTMVAKKHVFGSEKMFAGTDYQTLACALAIRLNLPGVLTPNGTAVEGVCVTGAASRVLVPFVGMELSWWQDSMAQYLRSWCARALSRSRYK